jgi:hypothetical protein
MADLNTGVRRLESGSSVLIGTDVVKNIQPGSISWNTPIRQRLEFTDRSVQQVPLEGDDQLCDISISLKAGIQVTNGIINTLIAASTTNTARTFAFAVRIPNLQGATVGESFTWAAVWLAEPPQFQAGADFDTITINLKSVTGPTVAAYS